VQAINGSLKFSTLEDVEVVCPTQHLTKVEIVQMGRWIEAPLELIWSCYRGRSEHCWECESCQRLKRALIDSGSWDWFIDKRSLGIFANHT
jgi:7-cyano-7-deazaguanine synthase